MNINLILKSHVENLTTEQGHDMIQKGHDAYQLSVDPYRRPEHIYGVSIVLTGLYEKLMPKNC